MTRPSRTVLEAVIANCRPQPAIPAVLVLMITLLTAMSAGAGSSWAGWLIGAGIVASCGLAIAAGFCSLAPPVGWLALAWLSRGIFDAAPGGPYTRAVLLLGVAAAAGMVGVQVWRILTGRFVPTIGTAPDAEA